MATFQHLKRISLRNSLYKSITSANRNGFATITKQRPLSKVNQIYEPECKSLPEFNPIPNSSTLSYSDKHNETEWNDSSINEALEEHCIMAWGATDPMLSSTARVIRNSDGVYLYDSYGQKYIDFSSQAICVNLGHTMPDSVRESINTQINNVSFLYGGLAISEIRARLCSLLSEIVPGDINSFLFPSSGAEANECAIRIARKYTGKYKILSRYRSYHGGTLGSLSLTGDCRRWQIDNQTNGFIKIFDPYPMYFKWTDEYDEDKLSEKALNVLHEQILLENPDNIAALFIEPITGANGWLKPPVQYIQGLRAICDKYNILLIADEVMAGFGRTGKMFSFEHFDGVQPDIVTFAKGLTSSYVPLSGIGVSDNIMQYLRGNPLGYGSTFQAHPVALSCAYAVVKYMLDNNIVQHSSNMENVIATEMDELINDTNNVIAQARIHGMGGCLDIMNPSTKDIICSTNEIHPKMVELKKNSINNGLIAMIRGPVVHITPPLIAQPDDIKYGFDILRKSLIETFN